MPKYSPTLDHLGAMHSDVVVPLLRAWLGKVGRQQQEHLPGTVAAPVPTR